MRKNGREERLKSKKQTMHEEIKQYIFEDTSNKEICSLKNFSTNTNREIHSLEGSIMCKLYRYGSQQTLTYTQSFPYMN